MTHIRSIIIVSFLTLALIAGFAGWLAHADDMFMVYGQNILAWCL